MQPPETMRAVSIREPGGPEVLVPTTVPTPQPGPNEVLVRVQAAGVNRPDCFQRMGAYPVPPGASPLPGLEIAGEIAGTGPGATRWQAGDRVCALTHGGGYAEYCTVHESNCLPVPDNLSALEAAAIPETFFTVYFNVWMRAGFQPGETLLVHGGSSGIGSTVIQMVKSVGGQVVTTAGTDEKCEFCRSLGADIAINYRDADWVAATREAFPDGVNVVLDMVAGDYVQRNLELLAVGGRYALIAFLRGSVIEQLDISPILRKRLTFSGSTLRPLSTEAKGDIAARLERDFWPRISVGGVRPVIYADFPLEEAAAAHALMESSEHMGKIMLVVDEDARAAGTAERGA